MRHRSIQFFHLPVPKPRTDDAYFAPLAGLKLRNGRSASAAGTALHAPEPPVHLRPEDQRSWVASCRS
jgi:hypothetical protein